MARILSVVIIVATLGSIAWGVVTVYDARLSEGRMWRTPAIKPYEIPAPVMAAGGIPSNGGEQFHRSATDSEVIAPFSLTEPAVIEAGKTAYKYYCVHCHGRNFDGYGTVGQSFAPSPTDLRGARVQALSDGTLFKEVSFGIPGRRQPALAATIDPADRWRVVAYVKSLGLRN